MPTANIHVGAGKCGSTLIQRILRDADVQETIDQTPQSHYSSVLMSHTPCFDFEDYNYQQFLTGLEQEIPLVDSVFSCENLIGVHTHREPTYDNSVKVIEKLFSRFDSIRILIYVRRHDDWLEAMYAQDVKRQERRIFTDYFSHISLEYLHWDKLCDAFGSAFELTVLPFESRVLKTGGYETFVHGFFNWLGANVVIENLPVENPSLSPGGHQVQFLANHVLSEKEAYDLSYWLEKHSPKKPGDRFTLMSKDERKFTLDYFRDSNHILCDKYLTDFDPAYYLE